MPLRTGVGEGHVVLVMHVGAGERAGIEYWPTRQLGGTYSRSITSVVVNGIGASCNLAPIYRHYAAGLINDPAIIGPSSGADDTDNESCKICFVFFCFTS